jgi:hypothetical protein
MEIKFSQRSCITLLMLLCLGGYRHSALAQSSAPPTEEPTTPAFSAPPGVAASPLESTPTMTDNMDPLTIAALAVSGLSFGIAVFSFWRVLDLQKKVLFQRKKEPNGDRNVKTPEQSISLMELDLLKKELAALKQKVKSLEQGDRFTSSSSETANVPVQNYDPPQETYVNPSSGYAQIFAPPQADYSVSPTTPSRSQSASRQSYNPPPSSNPLYTSVVSQYNQRPETLERSAIGVAETLKSLERRRQDSETEQVTLNRAENYSYWVISGTDQMQWLLPRAGLKIHGMTIDTFARLFQFQGHPDAGRLVMQKPAQVAYLAGTDEWELVEKGEVQFM